MLLIIDLIDHLVMAVRDFWICATFYVQQQTC